MSTKLKGKEILSARGLTVPIPNLKDLPPEEQKVGVENHLKAMGFQNVKVIYRPGYPRMQRWYCKISGVYAARLSGRVNGWAQSAEGVIMEVLACEPRLDIPYGDDSDKEDE